MLHILKGPPPLQPPLEGPHHDHHQLAQALAVRVPVAFLSRSSDWIAMALALAATHVEYFLSPQTAWRAAGRALSASMPKPLL